MEKIRYFLYVLDSNPNPIKIASKLKSILVGIASAMACGIGFYLAITGIQNLGFARESHDTYAMLMALLKFVAGIGCFVAAGIATFFINKL